MALAEVYIYWTTSKVNIIELYEFNTVDARYLNFAYLEV